MSPMPPSLRNEKPSDIPAIFSLTGEEMQAQVAEGFAASGITEEELEEYMVQLVKQVRAENW